MFQRQLWLTRPVGLAVPLTLLGVGVGALFTGSVIASSFSDCDTDPYGSCSGSNGGIFAGILLWAGGAVVATVGTGILISRLVRRGRRRRELLRIDSELQRVGATASLAPWLDRSGSSASGGLATSIRF